MTHSQCISIGAEGLDVEAIVAEIEQAVEARREQGEYNDSRIALAERHNLQNLKDDPAFLERYLECMRPLSHVDISDFEIVEKRKRFSGLLIKFKTAIWNLLRFYTFRLWSQQNQVNGILLSAIELTESKYKRRVDELEARLERLESQMRSREATNHSDA